MERLGECSMNSKWINQPRMLMVALIVLFSGFGLAGCEDVTVDRDPNIPIIKGMTWAWRTPPSQMRPRYSSQYYSDRQILSRDSGARKAFAANTDFENETVRERLQLAIEKELHSKGLVEVDNPGQADFLVDYHIGVQRRREMVATSAQPMIACGPYGCGNGWGWGYWGPPEVMLHPIQYREGTIVFDLVQRAGNRLAFRAISKHRINRGSFKQGQVSEGMKELLEKLKTTK